MRMIGLGFFCALFAAFGTGAALAQTEGFEGGMNGWERASSNFVVEYRSDGGNPGGWIKAGANDTSGFITKTGPFIGNYQDAGYREIAVDFRADLLQLTNFKPEMILRASPSVAGWRYEFVDLKVEAGTWQPLAAPVDPDWSDAQAQAAGWVRDTGPAISFADTLCQVWVVGVRLRYPPITAAHWGIDNFELRTTAQNVPASPEEPDEPADTERRQRLAPVTRTLSPEVLKRKRR